MITTVVFDLDDTLYDETEYCKSAFVAVSEFLANLPGSLTTERIFNSFWNQFTAGNRTKTFDAALDGLGINYDDTLIQQLIKVYRSHVPKIILPDDSRDMLNRLISRYTLGLLTDGFLPAQQLKVRALGIEKYFKCIIYTEQLGRNCWKPSPAGFGKLMQTLNLKPENMAYIADNEKKDFIAPNKLGILSIQITRPARIHTESSQEPHAPAQYIIRKISQLPALLDKL